MYTRAYVEKKVFERSRRALCHDRSIYIKNQQHSVYIHVYISQAEYTAYLGVEVAALLHESADGEPEAVGEGEVVDHLRQWYVLVVGVEAAHVDALLSRRGHR